MALLTYTQTKGRTLEEIAVVFDGENVMSDVDRAASIAHSRIEKGSETSQIDIVYPEKV